MAKSTAAEVERRIEVIRPLVVECLSLREIRTWTIKHTDWGAQISEVQLKRYIARARQQMKAASAVDRDYERGAAKMRCERVIAKAAAKGDLRSDLAANRQLADLFDLNAPKRSQVNVSGELDIPALRTTLTKELAKLIAEGEYTADEN